jgi:hypothetical protein
MSDDKPNVILPQGVYSGGVPPPLTPSYEPNENTNNLQAPTINGKAQPIFSNRTTVTDQPESTLNYNIWTATSQTAFCKCCNDNVMTRLEYNIKFEQKCCACICCL